MSINAGQFRKFIVRPTLEKIGLWSPAAEELLMFTAAHESDMGTYLVQVPNGPALGIYQMEPRTHDDIWKNYLHHHVDLQKKVYSVVMFAQANELIYNHAYATAMARVHYLRVKEPLPPTDILSMAHYWGAHWQTQSDLKKIAEAIADYKRYVLVSA